MRNSIVIPLSVLVAAFAFQTHVAAQSATSDGATTAKRAEKSVTEQGDAQKAPEAVPSRRVSRRGDAEETSTELEEPLTKIMVVPSEELADEVICEYVQRPGSRMARKVCTTRQQQLANRAANEAETKDQLADLQREQRWRDEIINEAIMNGRRPSGFGLGPN